MSLTEEQIEANLKRWDEINAEIEATEVGYHRARIAAGFPVPRQIDATERDFSILSPCDWRATEECRSCNGFGRYPLVDG